jgi:hypothetical protein
MTRIDVAREQPVLERTGFRLSWGAVLAGMVIATVAHVVLTLLGLAIGLGAWDQGDPVRDLGIGAGIWLLASAVIALFLGGLTTGRLAGVLTRGDGMLHGMLMWGLATLLGLWLVSSGVGALVGGTFNILGSTVRTAAQGVAGAVGAGARQAGDVDMSNLESDIERILVQTRDPALRPDSVAATVSDIRETVASDASNREIAREVADLIRERAANVDRAAIVNVIAARTDLSRAEVERAADRVSSFVAMIRTQIASTADTVQESAGEVITSSTDAISSAALWTLVALALGAAAAAGGAAMMARH